MGNHKEVPTKISEYIEYHELERYRHSHIKQGDLVLRVYKIEQVIWHSSSYNTKYNYRSIQAKIEMRLIAGKRNIG